MLEVYIISLAICIVGSLIAYGMSDAQSYFDFMDGGVYYVPSVFEHDACAVYCC